MANRHHRPHPHLPTAIRWFNPSLRAIRRKIDSAGLSAQDPGPPRKEDEPLPYGSPVDYRYELEILTKRRDDDRERLDRIESKIAVVIAGAFAALGFSLDKSGSIYATIAAGLYLIPIVFLLIALLPVTYTDAPNPREFEEKFPWYPITTLKAAVGAIVDSLESNNPKIERKLNNLRIGIWGLVVITSLVVAVKFYAAIHGIK
ncbi:MAG TPA: hypothetical protein VFO29_01560 [Candidatus Rubrimentiphilum sp.]|nr:hypothetical protein [Candidatus Rubrimentiphilum sp.]